MCAGYLTVVIAQLNEVLEWLTAAAATGAPAFSPRFTLEQNKAAWKRKLDSTMASCARLIKDGGADYDGNRVCAATLAVGRWIHNSR